MAKTLQPSSPFLRTRLAEVHDFWFHQLTPDDWFSVDERLDQTIRQNFSAFYEQLRQSPPATESLSAREMLALILLFDQFPRNMFRGSARAFESDPLARRLTRKALERKLDEELSENERAFIYMPLEHSENLDDQELCVRLFEEKTRLEEQQRYAVWHRDIIRQFGRFPHRNALLGRPSTAKEQDYLQKGGPAFGTRK
ncbi:DUF924 family protein [Luteithermobacter gelatinilyticus]|uniref:DUF924 family protein n=1 Tax=Luteithermobacter gelatinilyticus TaxID=2582913 RepID=UPI001106C6AD|nr:DUF924 family protein [Luteithermobacter gelatinilyticus]